MERFNRGELTNADSIHFPDSLKSQTIRMKRTVYGGGGIMPDYFVPIDTTLYTDYHRNLVAKGVIIKQVAKYIETHRPELKSPYKNFNRYQTKFEISESVMSQLKEMADNEGIKFD